MDLKKVKELIDIMKENDLVEIEVVDGDSKVHLKGPHAAIPAMAHLPMPAEPAIPAAAAAPAEAVDDGLINIESPIVGTFYQASSPDSGPYAKVGDQVNADTVVCIIEAMKVMNEIKAETTGGVIAEVCCKDGEAIEFGQVLFKVRP
jgi:acetyl-CoA carboxylase biotin carboxyl carrier protein